MKYLRTDDGSFRAIGYEKNFYFRIGSLCKLEHINKFFMSTTKINCFCLTLIIDGAKSKRKVDIIQYIIKSERLKNLLRNDRIIILISILQYLCEIGEYDTINMI